MNTRIILLNFLFAIPLFISAQTTPAPELIRETQRSVCAIKVLEKPAAGGIDASVGCGVVLMARVGEKNIYFVATAGHIISGLFDNEKAWAEISVFDKTGMLFKASRITKEHVIWRNTEVDAALVLLPDDLKPLEIVPEKTGDIKLSSLKVIGQPDWGQEIYLFGYRWLTGDYFLDILKKGILSVGTTRLPGYEGHLVYLIDNMANKGMSGGLAFTADGNGVGIISSYVYEVNSDFQKSDDLTVCLPLTFFFEALEKTIADDKEKLMRLYRE